MAYLQNQFKKFDDQIKITFEDSSQLREKKTIILNDLRDGLKRAFKNNTPTFESFDQGSYDLGTGIFPLSGEDYDIDVGIIFNNLPSTTSPTKVKEWVYNALFTGNRTVIYKRPCIRIQYHKKGEALYHVDLAIYRKETYYGITKYYLAKGYLGSKLENIKWEESNPFELKNKLKKKYSSLVDFEQFRRVIRYMKAWKDYNFSSDGNNRPTGIAITACAYNHFTYGYSYTGLSKKEDDLMALKSLVSNILIFCFGFRDTISVYLPVAPQNNLFEKMSSQQMIKFKEKLQVFKDDLDKAEWEQDISKACKIIQKHFGQDFPEK